MAYVLLIILTLLSIGALAAIVAACWWEAVKAADGWANLLLGSAAFGALLVAIWAMAGGITTATAGLTVIWTVATAVATRAVQALGLRSSFPTI